jgi:hypothetical protein
MANAALSIDDYLRGVKTDLVVNLRIEELATRSYRRHEDYENASGKLTPTISLDRRTGISEVEAGFTEGKPDSKLNAVSTATFKLFTTRRNACCAIAAWTSV